MGILQSILDKYGLKIETFKPSEREHLFQMVEAADKGKLTTDSFKAHIRNMRLILDNELAGTKEDLPGSWLSLFALFFPLYGIIKKWYRDREKMYLEARIRNLILLESFLVSPDRARAQLEVQLDSFAKRMKQQKEQVRR